MKKILIVTSLFSMGLFLTACGGKTADNPNAQTNNEPPKSMVADPVKYDPKRGEGKFNAENVKLGALDGAMAQKGEAVSNTKCFSCHKLTDEKLVGPGWKDVTKRRTPHWIMNFISNPGPMIDKDPEVQAQLELCMVRMPNQNLTDDDARQVLEFMRKNDGAK